MKHAPIAIATLIFLLFSIVISIPNANAQEESMDELQALLSEKAERFSKSKTFVKTDKDIYAPGEKIWFDAEILNCLTQKPAEEESLVVMVKAESGEVICDGKYLIEKGRVSNQITLPPWSPECKAYLIAYTPKALKTREASLTGIKAISINKLTRDDYLLTTKLDKKVYKAGGEVKIDILLSPISRSSKKEKLEFRLFDFHQEISSRKEQITVGETMQLTFRLPSKIKQGLYLQIESAGRGNVSGKIHIPTHQDQLNISFYPEGGHLLSNTIQRIVYRAMDPFGNKIEVAGRVYDKFGNQVGMGKTLSPGIGLISLMSSNNQEYIFVIESEYGKGQSFTIEAARLSGTAFSLTKTEEENLRVAIHSTGNAIGKELSVAIVADGKMLGGFSFVSEKKSDFTLSKKDLPPGIVDFVVFDKNLNILSERLVYINPKKEIDIDIDIVTRQKTAGDSIEIMVDINRFTALFGESELDIKVVDAHHLFEEPTEVQYNFLRHPLQKSFPETVLDLYLSNIELIANENRYISLSDLLSDESVPASHDESCLTGWVHDKNGKRIPNATVIITRSNDTGIRTTKTDKNGVFAFTNCSQSKDLIVRALSEDGRKNYAVTIEKSFDESLDDLLLHHSFNVKMPYSQSSMQYYEQNEHLLRQLGTENKEKRPTGNTSIQNALESGTSVIDAIRMIKSFSLIDNQIVFYGTLNSIENQQGAMIVIDGQKMGTSIEALNMLNPFDVVSIRVSTSPGEIQKYTGLNAIGIIEIRTRGSMDNSPTGLQKEKKEKHISTFSPANFPESVWNYQSTLLWQPNTVAGTDGKIRLIIPLNEFKTEFVIQVDVKSERGITFSKRELFSTY